MTKKILSSVLASMIIFSGVAFAQTKTTRAAAEPQTKTGTVKGEAICVEDCEFEGLNLTDTQKEQLKTLKDQQIEKKKAAREAMKAERQADKEKAAADRKAMKEQRENEKREYLKEVKNILGPDNYVLFLENQYVQSAPRGDMGPKMGKGGRPGKMEGFQKNCPQGKDNAKCSKDVKKCDKEGKKCEKGKKGGKGQKTEE